MSIVSDAHPVDVYFAQLANTEEWQNGKSVGTLGEVFIRSVHPLDPSNVSKRLIPSCRCNNVLYIRAVE